jgi:phosphoglucomutase
MTKAELKDAAELYLGGEFNPNFAQEVESLLEQENWDELTERFYTSLSFGTGGLRGTIGGGTNRMNTYMVARATQGLANYVNQAADDQEPKAVIAYDSRNYSDIFAETAALVLAGNGIKTYLFSSLRPTPELSYAVRQLGATTGIVVTASHNPPEYNGYKVYWKDGAQVIPPHDKGIIAEVQKITTDFTIMDKEEALEKGQLIYIDEAIDRPYLDMIKAQSVQPDLFRTHGDKLKVVYTPLHGTGGALLPQLMEDMGVDLIPVPEQSEPNGDFPTVTSPNPEEASAMKMAVELAKEKKADLVIGTDPDSDRIGIAVPQGEDFVLLNGNQLGSLLADYIFDAHKKLGSMPAKPVFINTIVTTDLQRKIASSYGAETMEVLTGFKWIGEKIKGFETDGSGRTYVFGGEESYGFLMGDSVRDKDAISSAAITIEMALDNLAKGRSILEHLDSIYSRFGYYKEILISKVFKGLSGLEKMQGFMDSMRGNPPATLGGIAVSQVKDIQEDTVTDLASANKSPGAGLPRSNVIQFVLSDGSLVTIRPSGTEPKVKFYASCTTDEKDLSAAKAAVDKKIAAISDNLDDLLN